MNFPFVTCTVALWGLEYLLGLEDTTQRGQRGATSAGWGTDRGAAGPTYPNRPSSSNHSNRLLSVHFGERKNKVEIHRTDGLRLLTSCLRLPSNSGPRKKMEILKVSWAPHLIFLHIG